MDSSTQGHSFFGDIEEIEKELVAQLKSVYLLINNTDRGSIDYVMVKEIEQDGTAQGSLMSEGPGF